MATRKRVILTLDCKVKVIRQHEKGICSRQLAAAVRCQSPTSLLTNKMFDLTTVKKVFLFVIDTIINHYISYILYMPSVYFMTITSYSTTMHSNRVGLQCGA